MHVRLTTCFIRVLLLSICLWGGGYVSAFGATDSKHRVLQDTFRRVQPEYGTLRSKMMNSPFPVELRQRGRQIFAQTKNAQILPVYTGTGSYYAAFRLTKGVNWISGLPRGTYYINGRKFTIS